jgi:hypothetical protein
MMKSLSQDFGVESVNLIISPSPKMQSTQGIIQSKPYVRILRNSEDLEVVEKSTKVDSQLFL